MNDLKTQIDHIKQELLKRLDAAQTMEALEVIRVEFLGRQGLIASLMDQLKALSAQEKRIFGPLLNELKLTAQELYAKKETALRLSAVQQQEQAQQAFDVTAYKRIPYNGSIHVYTQVINDLQDIFLSMGYQIVDGPEVETDYYNFEALNIPSDHPARDMHDTFWLDIPGLLLRTHTSPVQIHTMQVQKPPLAIFAPGRVYRNEATDASHEFAFMQGEGMMVDKHISLSHLIATMQMFLQKLFSKEHLAIRVRPSYFPFVEPGVEIDAQCPFCTAGCSVCKRTGWIEISGAGLIHPNVLRACNIDPSVYSGFAFGFGLSRLAMLKHDINDVRLLHSKKVEFLEQF